jgi:hypothetical protein
VIVRFQWHAAPVIARSTLRNLVDQAGRTPATLTIVSTMMSAVSFNPAMASERILSLEADGDRTRAKRDRLRHG